MKAPTSKRQDTIKKTILVLLGLLLSFAIVRESFSVKHDFSGYIIAGEAAWNHTDIYVSHLNTWPPSFSVISIPLYLLNSVNSNVMQFVWLTGFCICLVLCIKWTYELFFNKPLLLNFKSPSEKNETLNSWLFIIPFLLSFRILFEEIVNIQINIYLMTLCLLALKLSLKHKNWQAGFLIAFTIACKVYTVILLPLFLFRKKFKLSAYTLVFLAAIHAIVFAYFGIDTAIEHHVKWFTKDVVTKHIYDYGNS